MAIFFFLIPSDIEKETFLPRYHVDGGAYVDPGREWLRIEQKDFTAGNVARADKLVRPLYL